MRRPCKLGLILFITGIMWLSHGFAAPWSDEKSIEVGILNNGSSAWSKGFPFLEEHYSNRFGAFTDIMIWEDLDVPRNLVWIIRLDVFHDKAPSWDDLRPYLFFRFESAKTSEIRYEALTESVISWVRGPIEAYKNKIGFTFNVRVDKLSVPSDTSAWMITLGVYSESPPSGNLICASDRSPFIAKSARETPVDTLMWAKEEQKLENNPDLCAKLLVYFPNNRTIINKQIDYYQLSEKCDSLYYYSKKYLSVVKNRLDPFYLDRSAFFDDHVDPDPGPHPMTDDIFNGIIKVLLDTYGDTTGLTQYAP